MDWNEIEKKSKELLNRLNIHEDEQEESQIEQLSEEGSYIPFDFNALHKKLKKYQGG